MSFEWLNENSRKFLQSGYTLEGETAEGRIRDICDAAEKRLGLEGFSNKMYDYMAKGFYSLSSPVWANYGREDRGLPISCFNSHCEDSIPDILFTQSEIGIMSKLGGGTSVNLTPIRPRGSDITNNGKTSGAVHFARLFEQVTDVISQGSQRRGRVAPYLSLEHADAEEFLEIARDGNLIQDVTTGVTVSDEFMESVKRGETERDKRNRKIWAKTLKVRGEIGFPYLVWLDNANRNKPEVYKDKGMDIHSSNLCVSPETKILTSEGYIEIAELENEDVQVWNGKEWSETTVRRTGDNQKLVKVITSNGLELECTPYHKFYVQTSYSCSKVIEKRAQDLQTGDKLIKFDSLPVVEGSEVLDNAYANGFYTGDGCLTADGKRIYLYHDKRLNAVKERLGDIFKNWYVQDNLNREYGHSDVLKDKFFVPTHDYTVESRLEWLAGIFDSDGTIARNGKTQSLQLGSINKGFLQDVQMMLQTLGVNSRINHAADAGERMMPANDGSGENKAFYCQEAWRLLLGQHEVGKLVDLGIKFSRLNLDYSYRGNRECSHFNKVVEVIDEGRYDNTYCFTESKRGMGMFNGILTGQCSEISLPSNNEESFVCVLSSMNLKKYDDWKDTDAVETLVYFLDSVVTESLEKLEAMRDSEDHEKETTFFFMKRAYRFMKRHRALGMGVLAYHTMLQDKMIPFESGEARELNKEVHKVIEEKAYKASKELAGLFGEPEVLEGYGRRNTTLMACAPTKSSSLLAGGVSQGIEPLFSNYYIADFAKLKVEVKSSALEKLLQEYGKDTPDVWDSISKNDGSVQHLDFLSEHEKNVFKTMQEISPKEIIDHAADRQVYYDQSQSLNIMVHPSMPVKEINSLMYYAWERGVVSLYYQYNLNASKQLATGRKDDCVACEA